MYARYEHGANELPIRHLIRLCQYYHVSADYFLGLSKCKDIKKEVHLFNFENQCTYFSMSAILIKSDQSPCNAIS